MVVRKSQYRLWEVGPTYPVEHIFISVINHPAEHITRDGNAIITLVHGDSRNGYIIFRGGVRWLGEIS